MKVISNFKYLKVSEHCFQPLNPFRVVPTLVAEPQVEEGWEDESEEGYGAPTHQVQDATKAGNGLCHKQQGQHTQTPK